MKDPEIVEKQKQSKHASEKAFLPKQSNQYQFRLKGGKQGIRHKGPTHHKQTGRGFTQLTMYPYMQVSWNKGQKMKPHHLRNMSIGQRLRNEKAGTSNLPPLDPKIREAHKLKYHR